MSLQSEYLANKQSEVLWSELFVAVYKTAMINILALKKTDDVESMAADVAADVMARYNKGGWSARSNLGKVIYAQCFFRLFDQRYKDPNEEEAFDFEDNKEQLPENFEAIEKLKDTTQYAKQIIAYAKVAINYQRFIRFVAQRHSLGWMKLNFDTVRLIWDMRRNIL